LGEKVHPQTKSWLAYARKIKHTVQLGLAVGSNALQPNKPNVWVGHLFSNVV